MYTVSEDRGSVTVGIVASNAPQSTASFEVTLQNGTAQGMDVGIVLLTPVYGNCQLHSAICLLLHSFSSFLYA